MNVARDGFELRYGEPPGGITLWDLDGNSAVYVFESDEVQSADPPEGVRISEPRESFGLTFVDPQTGEDLVTFTMEDLEPIFGAAPTEPGLPESWVGWSADGTEWGWQSIEDAFGLAHSAASVQVAVGRGFAVALVEAFNPFSGSPDASDSDIPLPEPPRLFIARIP